MPNVALMALQAGGKLRRFVQANVFKEKTREMLAKRKGECNRCGACCKILFRCPFLLEDVPGQYSCFIYENRFESCHIFPLHPKDLREVEACSYTFEGAPVDKNPEPVAEAWPAVQPSAVPQLDQFKSIRTPL